MNYQHPYALYLLLIIPPVIVLYFIRAKRTEYYTPTYFLWAQIAEQTRPKTLWQKLFHNIILLFQVLIVTFLTLALARPDLKGELDSKQPVLLIIDNSASMQAVEGGKSRLAQAKEAALQLLEELGGRQVMLAGAISDRELFFPITNDRLQLAADIRNLPATDGADNFARLIPQLLTHCLKPPRIYLISDGASSQIPQLLASYPELKLVIVGQKSGNLAILGVEARRNPLSREHYQIMIKVANYGLSSQQIKMETFLENKRLYAGEVNLAADKRVNIIVNGRGPEGGIIHSRLLVNDAFMLDNQAYTILEPERSISLLAVDVNNRYLQRALGVLDQVQINPLSRQDYEQLAQNQPFARFDVGVFYGFMPRDLLCWNNVIINPNQNEALKINTPVSWDQSHPLMSYLELSNVQFKRVNALELYPQSQVLVQAGDVPLLVYDMLDRYCLLRLGFALEDSDFQLRPSFPIFLVNVIKFFTARTVPRALVKLTVGEPYLIPVPAGLPINDEAGRIITPQGEKIPVRLDKGGDSYYRPLRAGIHKFVLGGFNAAFIAALAESESRITPYDGLSSEKITQRGFWGTFGGYVLGWRMFALLAFLLIILEWWYQRENEDALC
jgi:hypothetical protein